jgi:hypothetical protein
VVGRDAVPRWLGVLAAVCILAGTPRALAQPAQQSSGSQRYAVDGLALGARIPFDSSVYREYKCSPSDQFDGFTWCQKARQERERRVPSNATYSVLHARDGSVVYVNRYREPIFFGPNEAERDIQSYSRKFGEPPRITRAPPGLGFTGILASWGKTVLEPLDIENRNAFAEGKRLTKGYYIDFIGNFDRSAKEGFPIYRISGGAGFVWVASFDQRGRGTLRLVAVDASAFYPGLVVRSQPNETQSGNTQPGRAEAEVTAAERPNADADTTHQTADTAADKAKADSDAAREEFEAAKRDVQLAKTEIEGLNAERAKLNVALERLEADKTAAEAKAQTMESFAYGGIAISIALLAIVSSILFVSRKQLAVAKRQWVGAETNPSQVAGHSPVVKTERESIGGEPQRSETGSSPPEVAPTTLHTDIAGSQSESGVPETKSTPNSKNADGDVAIPPEKIRSEAKASN